MSILALGITLHEQSANTGNVVTSVSPANELDNWGLTKLKTTTTRQQNQKLLANIMINISQLTALLSLISVIHYASALAPATAFTAPSARTKQPTKTQLSAWSIPVPSQRSFLSPSNTGNTWYEDYGQAAVDRHVRYQEDERDDYIWDSGDVKGVGYGFARIESYETYLAYEGGNNNQVLVQRKSSLLRRGLRKVWDKLQQKR